MISSFLQAHGSEIESASLTADEVTIDLKPLEQRQVVVFFADLISFVQPRKAFVNPRTGQIRLELS